MLDCEQRRVRADFLDAFVWKHIQELLMNPGILEEQLNLEREAIGPRQAICDEQITRIQRDVESQRRRMERLLDLYQDGIIEKDAYTDRSETLGAKVAALEKELADMERQNEEDQHESRLLAGVDAFRSVVSRGIEKATFEDRQRICRLVIESVEVREDEVTVKHILQAVLNTAQCTTDPCLLRGHSSNRR